MKKKKLAYLFKKYNSGKCNDQELKVLEDWYNQIDYRSVHGQDEEPPGFEEEMLEDFHYKRLRLRMKSISNLQKKRVTTAIAIGMGIAIAILVIVLVWVLV